MPLPDRFIAFIKQEHLFNPGDKLLLAVSGGVDSVVLCELCKQATFDFVIAHCNFQLRGEESDRDEKFVRGLAEKYGVEIFVKRFDTNKFAEEKKCSIQVAARELRYEWFRCLTGNQNIQQPKDSIPKTGDGQPCLPEDRSPIANWILTAHHADDNIETLLMNFFKGTGISGLRGILASNGQIIRPLLFAHKKELKQFATENNLDFLEDSSNVTDKYTRNYFRNQLIPSIQKVFPQAEQNLAGNLQRFRDIEILYQQSIALHRKKLQVQNGSEVHIPVLKLLQSEPLATIVYELFKPYGFTPHQSAEIIHLLGSESGKYVQSPTHRIIKNRKWLIISPNISTLALNILIEEKDREVAFNGSKSKLQIEKLQPSTFAPKSPKGDLEPSTFNLPTSTAIACLDADEITFPLMLRKWKQGDYFYPLGMDKKKKLSRFFIDQKLSLSEKENSWVIEMNKKIIWVVGKRIDDRFRVRNGTNNILKITQS
jgi:tRNA(Ile)-lysidine synthase